MHEKTKAYLERLPESQLRPLAYRWMYRSRRLDERLGALFRRGLVKGTVTQGIGNEAT
jgi:TPP-dependent pyruvate/acetoin dehydrogenase alpha subunit